MNKTTLSGQPPVEPNEQQASQSVFELLALPPKTIDFLVRNQKVIVRTSLAIVLVVVTWGVYSGWHSSQKSKSVSDFDQAMQCEGEERIAKLSEVAQKYSSLPAGTWAIIKIAEQKQNDGKLEEAAAEFAAIGDKLKSKNPLKPLLIERLGGIYEKLEQWDKAEEAYISLQQYPAFVSDAYYKSGRVYLSQGKDEQALKQYKLYLAKLNEENDGVRSPEKMVAESIVARLSAGKETEVAEQNNTPAASPEATLEKSDDKSSENATKADEKTAGEQTTPAINTDNEDTVQSN